jgi:hypothetical protein
MKNKNEFIIYVMENVRRYLPLSFAESQIFVEEKVKENGSKISALLIRRQEETLVPCIPLEEVYCEYMEGNTLEACVRKIADLRIQHDNLECLSDLSYVKDYGAVKERLMIRLCDPELNREWLADRIYTLQGDFVAVYYVAIHEEEEKTFSMPVSKQLLEEWKVSVKQLHEDVLLSENGRQACLFEMDDLICSLMADNGNVRNLLDGKTQWHPKTVETPVLCLTNSSMRNGASMILQEELMEQIGEIIGSDFYVLTSSIHETLLVPLGGMDVSELSQLVKEVNETQVELCDRLSDKVQYYDRAKGALENAERRNQARTPVTTNREFDIGKAPVFA